MTWEDQFFKDEERKKGRFIEGVGCNVRWVEVFSEGVNCCAYGTTEVIPSIMTKVGMTKYIYVSTPGLCVMRIHLVQYSTSARFGKNPQIFI